MNKKDVKYAIVFFKRNKENMKTFTELFLDKESMEKRLKEIRKNKDNSTGDSYKVFYNKETKMLEPERTLLSWRNC